MELAILNAMVLCDEFIIADNGSEDRSPETGKRLAEQHSNITYYRIDSPEQSQDLIQRYINTDTFIFAVDGDEIYDPNRLEQFRVQLVKGEYNDYWMTYGNVLHCAEIDESAGMAKGYLARPCRSMTKLYNFSLIKAWEGPCSERLHGGTVTFHDPESDQKRMRFDFDSSWEDSVFRCLHTVFLSRSSMEKGENSNRLNIHDQLMMSRKRKLLNFVLRLLRISSNSKTKNDYYMRGELVKKQVSDFFSHCSTRNL